MNEITTKLRTLKQYRIHKSCTNQNHAKSPAVRYVVSDIEWALRVACSDAALPSAAPDASTEA